MDFLKAFLERSDYKERINDWGGGPKIHIIDDVSSIISSSAEMHVLYYPRLRPDRKSLHQHTWSVPSYYIRTIRIFKYIRIQSDIIHKS